MRPVAGENVLKKKTKPKFWSLKKLRGSVKSRTFDDPSLNKTSRLTIQHESRR